MFKFDLKSISRFYESVRRAWCLVKNKRMLSHNSLYWFLEEPLINGARLDLCDDKTPGLKQLLFNAKITKMKNLIEVAGDNLDNADAVAQRLNIRSTRKVHLLLKNLRETLSQEEWNFLSLRTVPNIMDSFPSLVLQQNPSGMESLKTSRDIIFDSMGGKILYKICVKVINKEKLQCVDTPWREHLNVDSDVMPVWSSVYKPPLTKNVGDLQWRVLKGIIAVNAFISILNPTVHDKCPFCDERETIFHCFMHCERLGSLFNLLEVIFLSVDEMFTKTMFVFGFKYGKKEKGKGRLLNFILGQAKMAIYMSRRHKILYETNHKVELIFKGLIRARIRHDFNFYLSMNELDKFEDMWSVKNMLCWVENNVLIFEENVV